MFTRQQAWVSPQEGQLSLVDDRKLRLKVLKDGFGGFRSPEPQATGLNQRTDSAAPAGCAPALWMALETCKSVDTQRSIARSSSWIVCKAIHRLGQVDKPGSSRAHDPRAPLAYWP